MNAEHLWRNTSKFQYKVSVTFDFNQNQNGLAYHKINCIKFHEDLFSSSEVVIHSQALKVIY
jgi:hypothetical protein